MTKWSVPRMWDGETCAVLASGGSMSQAVADSVRGKMRVIAINTTFRLAPWADVVYASDAAWWERHYAEVRSTTNCLRVSVEQVRSGDVLQLTNSGRDGFDPDPSALRVGGNSGYAALHLAVHLGCKRILLCGFDMKGGRWHGKHPDPLRDHGETVFVDWIKRFDVLAPILAARGVEVVNCTVGSALHCFLMVDLEEAIETGAEPVAASAALQA